MPRQLQLEFYRHDPDHPGSLSPNAVNAMYSAPDGTLYAGTVEGGLNCLMPHSDHFIHYTTANSGLPHNSVSALTADSKGNLWIGTWGLGLAVMNLQHPGQISRILTEGNTTICFISWVLWLTMGGMMVCGLEPMSVCSFMIET